MAKNFKIFVHRNDNNIHMKLFGEFDGSSAYELLDQIERRCKEPVTVFIHTNSLKKVIPFGSELLKSKLNDLNRKRIQIVFTGKNARSFF